MDCVAVKQLKELASKTNRPLTPADKRLRNATEDACSGFQNENTYVA